VNLTCRSDPEVSFASIVRRWTNLNAQISFGTSFGFQNLPTKKLVDPKSKKEQILLQEDRATSPHKICVLRKERTLPSSSVCWLFIFKVTEPNSIPYRTHPACAMCWVRFPNERNQGNQAHPVLKYRVPHGSHPTISLPPAFASA
jgi:hypothetical protein